MAGVVVWSFSNDRHLWSVYEPDVSTELERLYQTGATQNVNLGTISQDLSSYRIDFSTMEQIQTRTGNRRPVHRQIISSTSPLGKGIVWAFEGNAPSSWTYYDIATMEKLEEAYNKYQSGSSAQFLDLQLILRQPYIIDFGQMTQARCDTGKVRRIQRIFLNKLYPSSISNASGAHGGGMSSAAISSQPFQSGQRPAGPTPWQCQGKSKSTGQKGRNRHLPYSGHASLPSGSLIAMQGAGQILPGAANQAGGIVASGLQQPSQSQGPVTRGRVQQHLTNNSSSSASQSSSSQSTSMPYLQHSQLYGPSQSSHHLQQQQPSLPQHMHPFSATTPMQPQHYPSLGNMFMATNLMSQSSGPYGTIPQFGPVISQPMVIGPPSSLPPPAHQQSQSLVSSTNSVYTPPQESLPTNNKIVIGKTKKSKPKTGSEVLGRYMESVHDDLDKEDCIICCDKLSEASTYGEGQPEAHDAIKLNHCGHKFHKLCLLEMYNSVHKDDSIQCPSCKTIYGEKTGICPPGYMTWKILDGVRLAGYEDYNTIHVSYHISPGVQGPEHPNPGERYSTHGFPRQGFFPDCDKGRKVLKLLIEAFKRRLMFTIGTSHTTGVTNTVTWNEIHHKTELHGNYSGHGYPDPNYLDNVLAELAAHGVTEDCLS